MQKRESPDFGSQEVVGTTDITQRQCGGSATLARTQGCQPLKYSNIEN